MQSVERLSLCFASGLEPPQAISGAEGLEPCYYSSLSSCYMRGMQGIWHLAGVSNARLYGGGKLLSLYPRGAALSYCGKSSRNLENR